MFKIKLKQARENAGLTQIQLSKKLGLSSGAVGNWEAGTREPGLKTIGRIAAVLKVKISDLVDIPDAAPQEETAISDETLKFALWGHSNMSDKALRDVRSYAAFVETREKEEEDENTK